MMLEQVDIHSPPPFPAKEVNSKWMMDLSIKCKIKKLLGKPIEENLQDLG